MGLAMVRTSYIIYPIRFFRNGKVSLMRVAFRSKNEVVYDPLRTSIIRGEYPPGSRLIIDEFRLHRLQQRETDREAGRGIRFSGFSAPRFR